MTTYSWFARIDDTTPDGIYFLSESLEKNPKSAKNEE